MKSRMTRECHVLSVRTSGRSFSVDANQNGPVEQATAFTDDEETHRAAVRSAVASNQVECARIAGDLGIHWVLDVWSASVEMNGS